MEKKTATITTQNGAEQCPVVEFELLGHRFRMWDNNAYLELLYRETDEDEWSSITLPFELLHPDLQAAYGKAADLLEDEE